jgi:hypothetical protein
MDRSNNARSKDLKSEFNLARVRGFEQEFIFLDEPHKPISCKLPLTIEKCVPFLFREGGIGVA